MGYIGSILKIGAFLSMLIAIFVGLLISGSLAEFGVFKYTPSVRGMFPVSLSSAEHAAAFKFDDLGDLTGHNSLVTGANVGLGYWTAYHLAKKVRIYFYNR